MAGNLIIAINRQYGSGGKEVGTKLAKALNIPIYDQEIPEMAAKKAESGRTTSKRLMRSLQTAFYMRWR